MRHVTRCLAVAATVLLCVTATDAQTSRPKLEVFNSFTHFQETGDLMGMEIILLRTTAGACVSYQEAEGGPGQSQVLPARVRGDSLFFTIPPDSGYELHVTRRMTDTTWAETSPAVHVRGRISPAGLSVSFDGQGPGSDWLPRRRRAYFPAAARKLWAAGRKSPCAQRPTTRPSTEEG